MITKGKHYKATRCASTQKTACLSIYDLRNDYDGDGGDVVTDEVQFWRSRRLEGPPGARWRGGRGVWLLCVWFNVYVKIESFEKRGFSLLHVPPPIKCLRC